MTDPMDHDRLCDLLDGRLDAAEAAALRARLEREPDLRAAWDDLVRLRDALRALPTPPVPAEFARTVRARIDAGDASPENDGVASPPGLPRLSHGPDGEVATPSAPRGLLLRFPYALVAATLVVGIGVGAVLLASRPDAPPAVDAARRPQGEAAFEAKDRFRETDVESTLEAETRTAGRAADARDELEREGSRLRKSVEPETVSGVAAPVAATERTEAAPAPDPARVVEKEVDDAAKAPEPAPAPAPVMADLPTFAGLDKAGGKDVPAPVVLTYVLEADSVESGRAAVAEFLAFAVTQEETKADGGDRDRAGAAPPPLRLYALSTAPIGGTTAVGGNGLSGGGGGAGGRAAAGEREKRRDPAPERPKTESPPAEPAREDEGVGDETFGAAIGEIPLVLTDAEARKLAVAAQPIVPAWRTSDASGDGALGGTPRETPPPARPEAPRSPDDEKAPQPTSKAKAVEPPPPAPSAGAELPPPAVTGPVRRIPPPAGAPPPPPGAAGPTTPSPTSPATPPAPTSSAPAPSAPIPAPAPKPAAAPGAASLPEAAENAKKKAEALPPPTVRVRILVVPPRR